MALPVIESYSSNTQTGSSSLTITKPANVASGDLLILIVGSDDSTNTQQYDTFSEGGREWTLIREHGDAACDCHIAAFYRISDGAEGVSVTIPAQSSDDQFGWYLRITGARNVGSPIHKYGQVGTTNGSTHTFNSLETVFKECLVIAVFGYDGGDSGTISVSGTDWEKQDELHAGTGSANASGAWAIKEMTDPGESETVTFSPSVNDGGCGFQFAIARNGAPSVEVKETVLRKLDDLWENIDPESSFSTEGEFVTDGDQTYYIHAYDKVGDAHTYIRIKKK